MLFPDKLTAPLQFAAYTGFLQLALLKQTNQDQ
jgi:hypothetical protein